MRVLAVVRTYYMFLVVSQLRTTVFRNDDFDVVITSTTPGNEKIFERTKCTNLFNNVYYLKMTYISSLRRNKIFKLTDLFFNILFSERALKKSELNISDYKYDILLCYQPNMCEEQIIFNVIRQYNPNSIVNLFEEGYSSYCHIKGAFAYQVNVSRMSFLHLFMKCCGKKNNIIFNNITKAWFFQPDLVKYKADFELCSIPRFNFTIIKILNYIFDYNKFINEFNANLFFLEDSFYMGNENYGDIDLFKIIVSNYKKIDRILVKLHPRSVINRFKSLGVRVSCTPVPFELIVLNNYKHDTIFITIASGGPLGALLNFDMNCKVIVLYKCCSNSPKQFLSSSTIEYFEQVKHRFPDKLLIPNSLDEFYNIINNLNK